MSERYCLIQDDDYHWYIATFKYKKAAQKYFEEVNSYWSVENYDHHKDEPKKPKWLKEIDGPHRLSFENWKEE